MLRTVLMTILLVVAFYACSPGNNSTAHLKTETLIYTQDGKEYEGFLALPRKGDTKRPAILLIHDWTGLDEYEKMRARMLAENGYVVLAMDMYGKGVRAKNHQEAAELSGTYAKNRTLLRSRVATALHVLRSRPEVDPARIAVLGYCFGGMAAIESALMAADIKAVVTFHAVLAFPTLAQDAANAKAALLIHHGGADKFVPEKNIQKLKSEFDRAKVRYRFVVYPAATHGFTLQSNTGHEEHLGMKYDAKADLESWASTLAFLREHLRS